MGYDYGDGCSNAEKEYYKECDEYIKKEEKKRNTERLKKKGLL